MKLRAVILENYRYYREQVRLPVDDLTVLVGKNDSGKSSVSDALAVFVEHPLGKVDSGDVAVGVPADAEVRIGCEFDELPVSIVIDASSTATLADEYLLDANGRLEIHKVWMVSDRKFAKPKTVAVAQHPSTQNLDELLLRKNADGAIGWRTRWVEPGRGGDAADRNGHEGVGTVDGTTDAANAAEDVSHYSYASPDLGPPMFAPVAALAAAPSRHAVFRET